MIFKNLFRQKGRTLLTIFGISIGVAAIVGLGALADGLKAGYDSILSGSKADLILAQQTGTGGRAVMPVAPCPSTTEPRVTARPRRRMLNFV